MKKTLPLLLLFLAALACNQLATPAPVVTPPATTLVPTQADTAPTLAPTVPPPTEAEEPTASPTLPPPPTETFPGLPVSFGALSLVLPPGLANGLSGQEIPAVEGSDLPYWEIAPEHLQLKLEGYLLQDKFHQPQIFVYPAEAFAAVNTGVAENIAFIEGVCCRAQNVPAPASLPHVPFFNAGQVFASNIQIIPFQNGSGVRFLTEYAQYFAYVNNTDLFYHYQGLTADGQYYVIVILPLTAPVLPPNAEPQTTLPPGGLPQPSYDAPPEEWESYYANLSALLENTPPDSFAPSLAQLDALIRSLQIIAP